MATGRVVGDVWVENGHACLAVAVTADRTVPVGVKKGDDPREERKRTDVEVIGRVPMDEAWETMTPAQRTAALVAAARAALDDAAPRVPPADPGVRVSGTVAL